MQLSVLTGGGSVWRERTTGGDLPRLLHLPQHSQATIICPLTFAHSLSYCLPSGPHASLFPTLSAYIARAASLPRSHFLFLVSSPPSHPPPDWPPFFLLLPAPFLRNTYWQAPVLCNSRKFFFQQLHPFSPMISCSKPWYTAKQLGRIVLGVPPRTLCPFSPSPSCPGAS